MKWFKCKPKRSTVFPKFFCDECDENLVIVFLPSEIIRKRSDIKAQPFTGLRSKRTGKNPALEDYEQREGNILAVKPGKQSK
jgi:hypothetical protein